MKKIALAQISIEPDMEKNFEAALSWMDRAAAAGAGGVLFPEVFLSPFFPQYPGRDASPYVMTLEHEMLRVMQEKSRRLGLVTLPNVYLREGDALFDASLVIDSDGKMLGVSKMVHIVQIPFYYEQDYYAPSDSGFKVYETALGKVGVVICFDRHFPESFRSCVLQGAELVVIATANIKGEPLEMFEWEMRIAAMQNGVYVAMCNRVGIEGKMDFAGESLVADPSGNLVAKADDSEQLLVAELDLSLVKKARQDRPFLGLRRPEAY